MEMIMTRDGFIVHSLEQAVNNNRYHALTVLLHRFPAHVDEHNDMGDQPLLLAVQRQDIPSIRILLRYGADPNLNSLDECGAMSHTPYFLAGECGYHEIVELFDMEARYRKMSDMNRLGFGIEPWQPDSTDQKERTA